MIVRFYCIVMEVQPSWENRWSQVHGKMEIRTLINAGSSSGLEKEEHNTNDKLNCTSGEWKFMITEGTEGKL